MNNVERGNKKRVERRAYQCVWLASHSKHEKYEAADGERKEKKRKTPTNIPPTRAARATYSEAIGSY